MSLESPVNGRTRPDPQRFHTTIKKPIDSTSSHHAFQRRLSLSIPIPSRPDFTGLKTTSGGFSDFEGRQLRSPVKMTNISTMLPPEDPTTPKNEPQTYASLPPSPVSPSPPPLRRHKEERGAPPFSIWDYLREELLATDFDSHQELKWERVSNFLSIPLAIEKVFGFLLVVRVENLFVCYRFFHLDLFCVLTRYYIPSLFSLFDLHWPFSAYS